MYLLQLSGMNKSENIKYCCKLMFEISNVPVRFLKPDGAIFFEYGCPKSGNPAITHPGQFPDQLLQRNAMDTTPVFTTTKYMEIYYTIPMVREGDLSGVVLAGPVIPEEMSIEAINTLFRDFEIPAKRKMELVNYYQSLQVISHQRLISTAILLYFLIYGTKLDSAAILERNMHLQKAGEKTEEAIENEISKNRQHSVFHHNINYEKELLKYVREGNKEKLQEYLDNPSGGESGKLSKNPLRSQKNLFICSATLITRAAIDGGLNSELAMTASDTYIQRMEELNEINEIMNLYYQMISDFTQRVQKSRGQNYSKAITQCLDYISKYLYGTVTLSQLAEVTGVSSSYLSELFKKEVGLSFREYILRSKVEEAKRLLTTSDDSIMDICTSLNFSDQSHFTKIFSKFAGVTPKQYRNRQTSRM